MKKLLLISLLAVFGCDRPVRFAKHDASFSAGLRNVIVPCRYHSGPAVRIDSLGHIYCDCSSDGSFSFRMPDSLHIKHLAIGE